MTALGVEPHSREVAFKRTTTKGRAFLTQRFRVVKKTEAGEEQI